MARATVDFGVDLGTTNSSIAVLRGTTVEVLKNNENSEITPSCVWIDKDGGLYVGNRAKQRLEYDQENAFSEFKLQMGTTHEYTFISSGRQMKPEEVSAQILKSLKEDVRQRIGEDLEAAVITVPAAFELPQCEATGKAAQIAGFTMSPLLQEPIAAAIAYGFQSKSDRVFWLVYDFGGGTFDAAVIQVRDGAIQIVNHGGDNHLGGKLLDWEIVEQLLVPVLTKERPLSEFRRSNPKWKAAFGKLKLHAEDAKIQLSRRDQERIAIEGLCVDDQGKPVDLEYTLKRSELERLMEPFVVRSINICKRVLEERHLHSADLEKLILVGGPTLTPSLRERLSDPKEGLGVPLEFSVDPMTVVVRGAAMFAGTQRFERSLPSVMHQHVIKLDYRPIGSDTEPLVGGQVVAPDGEDLSGFTLEFVNQRSRPRWQSGRLNLGPDGIFVTNLWAGKNPPTNTFSVRLYDSAGGSRQVEPAEFTYTLGLVPSDPPLSQSLGVALANNEVKLVVEKGTPLPVRKTLRDLKTTIELRSGQDGDLLKVPVVEGGNPKRADRNRLIGSLTIAAHNLRRDVPRGSAVEITIEVDRSRLVRTSAFIPVLGEGFESVLSLAKESPDAIQLAKAVVDAVKRLDQAREKAQSTADPAARDVLQRIDGEDMIHDVQSALDASQGDRDATDKCENRLLDLNVAIDELEYVLEWPDLLSEAQERMSAAKTIVGQYGSPVDQQELANLEKEISEAIEHRDQDRLHVAISELCGLYYGVLREQPGSWVAIFKDLAAMRAQMIASDQVDGWIIQGHEAIQNGDVATLKTVVHRLISSLPPAEQYAAELGFGSTLRLA